MNSLELIKWIVLVLSGSLVLYLVLPRIWHQFKVKDLISNPFTLVLALLIFGISLEMLFPKLSFLGEALIVVSLIGILLEVPHLQSFFQEAFIETLKPEIDLHGNWSYEVTDSNSGKIKQKGWCNIDQSYNDVRIKGRRTQTEKDDKLTPLEGQGKYWETEFAVIHGTGLPRLLFVYRIEDEGLTEGYCSIPLPKTPFNKIDGRYVQLAPKHLVGDVHFEREEKQ